MNHLIIVNPAAGKEKAAQKAVPYLQQFFQDRHVLYETRFTQYPGHAAEIVRQTDLSQPTRIYACGGDGTLNEVLRAAYLFPQAQVAHIPCGSGNDFLRNFGTQEEFLDFEDLFEGESIPIDLIETSDHQISASICSIGLDAKVAYQIPMFRRLPLCGGSAAYELSIVKCLLEPLGTRLSITIDGQTIEGKFLLACIANGQFYGGGYQGAPVARLDDGILELITIHPVSRLKIASLLSQYKHGQHFSGQEVAPEYTRFISHYRGKQIHIQANRPFIVNRDGECYPTQEISFSVLPKAAQIVLPKTVYERYCGSSAVMVP
ncbi:MAG: diacylglycerol/lipid kinase family protein [Massiliimalia sp.]